MSDLTLEVKWQQDESPVFGSEGLGAVVITTPAIDEDYWLYRVALTDRQAVVGIPKFGTIGIGFAVEEDWNTNLPFTTDAEQIFRHIKHNKGDSAIKDADVLEAILMIQSAARADNR